MSFAKFGDPHVHFALNCASRSCPPLSREAFEGSKLDAQFEKMAKGFVNSDRGVRFAAGGNSAELSKIFDWYKDDFKEGGPIDFINKRRSTPLPKDVKISYQEYDWDAERSEVNLAMVALATDEPRARQSHWRARWHAFRHPILEEKARVLKERWDSLPPELQTNNQISGRHLTHCGFTLGASYCSFHCTHCYLPKNANEIPIPSLEQVKEQIDANRRFQGPGGGLQITGGDVADAYWKSGRADELIEIVRYAYSVGSIPMLMTHGQTLIEHPEFLERLVVEGGLRQISVHVDMTQAGRHGYPIGRIKSEADLHPVRQAFTDLALRIRAKTGCMLEYALSFTVTRRNIDDVPEVIRWYLADPQRSYIWRMLSFQPEADTGRTIFSQRPITSADVWQKICEGTGLPLRRDVSIFGHPDCNSWALAPDRATFGKILSAPAGRQEVRRAPRRSAREGRRPFAGERRCRHASLSARRHSLSSIRFSWRAS